MNPKIYFLLIIYLSFGGCKNIKEIQSNEGVINIGNNNFVLNFPKVDSIYSSKEIAENILSLQNEFRKINKDIYNQSPLEEDLRVKFEKKDTINSNYSHDITQVNLLKETRESIFDALKSWENLVYKKNQRKRFIDGKTKRLNRYKVMADSLAARASKLHLDNMTILDSLLGENINSGKIDSLIKEYLFEKGNELPLDVDFVRKIEPKEYQRMMTLRENDLEIRKKGKRPYRMDLINKSEQKIFVAIRYFALDGQWIVNGWYHVEKNKNMTVSFYAKKNEFYFHAYVEGKTGSYGEGPSFYVAKGQAFEIVEKYDSDLYSQELKPFFPRSLSPNKKNNIIFE